MSTQKKLRREIDETQVALKARLVELYGKIRSGELSEEEAAKLETAIREIKGELEPKTRAACKHFGIPTDSELLRAGRIP